MDPQTFVYEFKNNKKSVYIIFTLLSDNDVLEIKSVVCYSNDISHQQTRFQNN